MSKTQQKVNTNTKPQDKQSTDLAKQELVKLLDDPDINHHGLLEHLRSNVCQVRVRNDMDTTIFVSVSKTAGQGQDGPFQINPRGGTETWSRYFFYQVTIRASHFFGGPEFDHVTLSLNPGTNSFRVEGDRIIGF